MGVQINPNTMQIRDTSGSLHSLAAIKGDKGEKGTVSFATFNVNIETGELNISYDEDYMGNATFSIDNNGILEVTL